MAVTKSFNVEFDDALLETAGWKGSRYQGSKLVAREINKYTPGSPVRGITQVKGQYGRQGIGSNTGSARDPNEWGGDITYGYTPVIERKVCALYIGNTLIGADGEDTSRTEITNHSYVTIEQILMIDVETDEVQIIDKKNLDTTAFQRFVEDDMPEGSEINIGLLDFSIKNSLKDTHHVKFNKGSLMRLYTYTANTGGFEDGVFGGHGLRHKQSEYIDNLGISGSDDASSLPGIFRGGGLFGFGQTAAASHSLFGTESLDFIDNFPAELSFYQGKVDMGKLGNELCPLTASKGGGAIVATTSGSAAML